ncbi:sensor histidine kinase [Streptomyces gossypiisoli]|uniref:sensor histidine kinase n=1 Tax=Streptomyces gossypiisoli TaxID=2748864 RepID=UPI0015DA4FD2|nr:ATP-binding protein [Streptomyces gossypiisoli]
MSHLRAPAARADRREGGRHGRPVAHPVPSLPEAHIRPQLLRLAVLPPVAVALSACAAVLFTVRSTGARTSLTLWAVLAGAVCVTLVGIAIAVVAAGRAARGVHERVGALRRSSARREADLRALVEALRRGEVPPPRKPRGGPPEDADDFELLAADLARAHDGAVTAVVQAAQLSSQAGSEQKLEVFVNLARRLQSLVHREIAILDELENEIEDPDLLKGLFHVDHLATRIRRHAENLAVLGGAVSRRQWSNPVSMTEVLRSAIAEVEQYSRVRLVPPIDGTLRGHAVADVIHLLAELVENATVFSAPHTQVLLRANLVTSGLAVEVEDRGLGLPVAEQHKMNALLTDPDQVNVARLLADGRIGLFVVSQLARRHGITVRLQTNIYGGVQAVLVVPQALLGSRPDTSRPAPPPQHHQPAPDAVTAPAPTGTAPDAVTAPASTATGPSPLPVRGAREERPNPAEAVPGIRSENRPAVEDHTGAPPTPPTGTVRGTMGKPQLPRRRAQQHIAPQLRGGPVPRQDAEDLVGHDPGLMAAFQRGIGLAEAQQQARSVNSASGNSASGNSASGNSASGNSASGHSGSGHQESPHTPPRMERPHLEPPRMERHHTPPASPPDARPTGVTPMPTQLPMAVPHMDVRHTGGRHMDGTRTGATPPMDRTHTGAPSPMDGRHMEPTHVDAPPHMEAARMTPDHPARHDGSGPAG